MERKPKWWLIHESQLRGAFESLYAQELTPEEVYALLWEHCTIEPIIGIKDDRRDPLG